jgi:hypothetical protein
VKLSEWMHALCLRLRLHILGREEGRGQEY